MLKVDLLHFLERVNPMDITKVVLVLRGGQGINCETVFRHEDNYVIIRGRESGSNDENRAFFVPYDEILFAKLERIVMLHELEKMYDCKTPVPAGEAKPEAVITTPPPASVANTPPPPQALDPATIARNNLLERIRAAKSTVGHVTTARGPKQ